MLFLSAVVVALLAGPDLAVAIPSTLQSILKNTHGSKEYGYPTDLTRDLLPVSLMMLYVDKHCGAPHHPDNVVNPRGQYLDSCSFSQVRIIPISLLIIY